MSAKMLRNGIQHNKRLPARALMFHQKEAGGKQILTSSLKKHLFYN